MRCMNTPTCKRVCPTLANAQWASKPLDRGKARRVLPFRLYSQFFLAAPTSVMPAEPEHCALRQSLYQHHNFQKLQDVFPNLQAVQGLEGLS